MLLLDRQSAIDGIVQRSRARGIVRVAAARPISSRSNSWSVAATCALGDVVITSGNRAASIPKGLRIGVIRGARPIPPADACSRRPPCTPSVDFGRLEQVFVMLRRGPTMDLLFGAAGDATPDVISIPEAIDSPEASAETALAPTEPPAS